MNKKRKPSGAYHKGYKEGYNNSGQFDIRKLVNSNSDMAKGIVSGICDREKDNFSNTVVFK